MSPYLLAIVCIIYIIVGIEMVVKGKFSLAMVWLGYAFALVGMIWQTIKSL
jgi:hypothetical protein